MSSCLWLPFILIDANFLGNAGLFAFASLIGLLMLMQCIDEGLELREPCSKAEEGPVERVVERSSCGWCQGAPSG